MANYCEYDIHVNGSKEGVNAFVKAFISTDPEESLGYIYGCDIYEEGSCEDGSYSAYLYGDCKWSLESAFDLWKCPSKMEKLIQQYGLSVEMYSKEPGNRFAEHCLYECGKRIEFKTTPYYGELVDNIKENEETRELFFDDPLVKEAGITPDNYMEFANGDEIEVGGFPIEWHF